MQKYPLNINRAPGFTLIELLVVVAVLALLGASLLPSVGHLRAKAAQARCANNMRILGVAWNMCVNDREGWLLPASFPAGKVTAKLPEGYPTNAAQAGIWWSKLAGYLPPEVFQDKHNVFSCPADVKPVKAGYGTNVLLHSYGYMDYFGYPYDTNPEWPGNGSYGLHRRKNMKKPGATPVLVEIADCPNKNSSMVVPAGGYGYAISTWMTFRHWGMGNVLFDDGHVEPVGTNNPTGYSRAGDFF